MDSLPRSYNVIVETDVPTMMRDGVTLYGDIYRPDAPGKFPVLVLRLPYNKDLFGLDQDRGFGYYFARSGYVVLIQDTRGRFKSEGDFYPLIHEDVDGYDTIEWAATLPWSTGKVGTVGQSYYGATQYLPAPLRPPHLAAAVPISAPSDWHRSWVYQMGGPMEIGWLLPYVVGLGLDTAKRGGFFDKYESIAEHFGLGKESFIFEEVITTPMIDAAYRKLPVSQWADILADVAPYFREYIDNPEDGPYWWRLDLRRKYHEFDVPMYHVGSWFDGLLEGTLHNYMGVRDSGFSETARKSQRLLIGPWTHVGRPKPYTYPHRIAGEADFGPEAGIQIQDLSLRWFDYWLKGIENGAADEPAVHIYVMGDNVWRTEKDWPPKGIRYVPFYLRAGEGEDHGLSRVPPTEEEPSEYTYDPDDPTPTLGGNTLVIPGGVFDQRPIEVRPDVLTFTSDVLTDDLLVIGPIVVKLVAASSAVDTDFAAKLIDVRPDGYAHNIQEGIIRARYRNGRDKAVSMKPGTPYEFEIDLGATAHCFKPGHRIRVDISSANFPRFDRNLNVWEHPLLATEWEVARQTIFHDQARLSQIVLPVMPR